MYMRDTAEFQEEQERIIGELVNEAKNGVTKLDILPNMAQPLQGEVEAMYFKSIRVFFENSISHKVMALHQDLHEGK